MLNVRLTFKFRMRNGKDGDAETEKTKKDEQNSSWKHGTGVGEQIALNCNARV